MLPGETPRQSRNAWLLVGALVLGAVAAALAWNEWDKTRYGPAKANITAISESCRVDTVGDESGRSRSETVEMPCAAARRRYTGRGYGFSDLRTIRYRFTSPVNGQAYDGSYHPPAYAARNLQMGQEIDILAHKTEPALSRQP